MSQLKNHSDFIQTLEHDDYSEPKTKRVSVYGWDADGLQKVRMSVDSTGKLNVNSAAPVGGATSDNQTNGSQVTKILDSLPTAGNNPSYVLSYNAAGYTVKIEETIGATVYTTTIVPQDSDTTITSTKSVSSWS